MTLSSEAAASTRTAMVMVDTSVDDADIHAAQLVHFGAESVETRDATTLLKGGALGATLVAHFSDESLALQAVELFAPNARIEWLEGDDWADAWKAHWKPTRLGQRLVIVPSWMRYEPLAGDIVLRLDPGRAFGTGQHASTALATAALEREVAKHPGATVLDVGCGSGILSFASVLFGAPRAIGCDTHAESIEVAIENATLLGFAATTEFFVGTCSDRTIRSELVVANIEAVVLVPIAEVLKQNVLPGGHLILSGILATQREQVVERYESIGFTLVRCDQEGDWIAPEFVLAKSA